MNFPELQTLIRECLSQISALSEEKLRLDKESQNMGVKIKKLTEMRDEYMDDLMSAVVQNRVKVHLLAKEE